MYDKYIVLYTDGSEDRNFLSKNYSLFYGRKKVSDLMDDNLIDTEQKISKYSKLELNKEISKVCNINYVVIIE